MLGRAKIHRGKGLSHSAQSVICLEAMALRALLLLVAAASLVAADAGGTGASKHRGHHSSRPAAVACKHLRNDSILP